MTNLGVAIKAHFKCNHIQFPRICSASAIVIVSWNMALEQSTFAFVMIIIIVPIVGVIPCPAHAQFHMKPITCWQMNFDLNIKTSDLIHHPVLHIFQIQISMSPVPFPMCTLYRTELQGKPIFGPEVEAVIKNMYKSAAPVYEEKVEQLKRIHVAKVRIAMNKVKSVPEETYQQLIKDIEKWSKDTSDNIADQEPAFFRHYDDYVKFSKTSGDSSEQMQYEKCDEVLSTYFYSVVYLYHRIRNALRLLNIPVGVNFPSEIKFEAPYMESQLQKALRGFDFEEEKNKAKIYSKAVEVFVKSMTKKCEEFEKELKTMRKAIDAYVQKCRRLTNQDSRRINELNHSIQAFAGVPQVETNCMNEMYEYKAEITVDLGFEAELSFEVVKRILGNRAIGLKLEMDDILKAFNKALEVVEYEIVIFEIPN